MKLLFGLLISLLFCQIAHSQNATIRGFVFNMEDGEPMPFEKVRLLKSDSSTVTGAITDVNGYFSMSKIGKGDYIVKVSSSQYNTLTESVSINKIDGITSLKFQLEKKTKCSRHGRDASEC